MATPVVERREAQFDSRTERDEESRQARRRLVAWSMVAVAAEQAKKAEEPTHPRFLKNRLPHPPKRLSHLAAASLPR